MKKIIPAILLTLAAYHEPSHASILNTKINMDNGYEIYLSTSNHTQGVQFGNGNNWHSTLSSTISLSAGVDYYLHVRGYDEGGIAGFLGEFTLSGAGHVFSNNSNTLLTNTTNWKGNNTGWNSPYVSVSSTGPNGAAPWGTTYTSAIPSNAKWIWVGDSNTNNVAYFSTKISATSSVPTPPALLLFGSGLLGLLGMRKKHTPATNATALPI